MNWSVVPQTQSRASTKPREGGHIDQICLPNGLLKKKKKKKKKKTKFSLRPTRAAQRSNAPNLAATCDL
jgi:hypothetical protein